MISHRRPLRRSTDSTHLPAPALALALLLSLAAGCATTTTRPPATSTATVAQGGVTQDGEVEDGGSEDGGSEGGSSEAPAFQDTAPPGGSAEGGAGTGEVKTGEVEPAPPMPEIAELNGAPDAALDPDTEPGGGDGDTGSGIAGQEEAEGDPESAEADGGALLEDSLEAFESADVFWQGGNFEDAFAALDRAYELMASVPSDGDPLLAQQKEDLRHLISRRVVEIYASRQTAVGNRNGSIPLVVNEQVEREIASFQGRERDFFLQSYRRSGLYRPMILEQLRQAGLPEQLSWLPLVESGFKVRALSRARALGLWQFIASTGYRYGLERDRWVDERMDPVKSTRAAIAYLNDLHQLFGDWMTALAAYNCGEGTVLRQIRNQPVAYFDRFWDLYQRLPRETRRYVPRLFAVLAILEDPEGYGFELPEPYPPLTSQIVEVERPVELERLDRALGLEPGTLAALNPELRHKATPDEPYPLRVPTAGGPELEATVVAKLAEVPQWEPPVSAIHRVRRGETLSGVASRYGTSVRALMRANGLRSAHRIWPGQKLRVPGRGGGAIASSGGSRSLAPGAEVTHRVRPGDSLWRIANRYGTTVDRIKRDNGLRGNLLRPGQRLSIRGAGWSGGGRYTVRRGDTLGAIARSQGVSLTRLLQANGLSRRSTIYPGQVLTIPQ